MKLHHSLMITAITLFAVSCSTPNKTGERVARFRAAMVSAESEAVSGTSSVAKNGVQNLIGFLSKIDQPEYISANAANVYASDAWLNDTLQTHQGPEEIGAYFVKLNDQMKDFAFAVDDISYASSDVYIRWRMDYRIPSLSKEPIKTIGMSQLRFDRDGLVLLQQDYWDSAAGVYEHIPGIGAVVGAGRD